MLYTRVRAKDLCTAFTTVRVLPVQFVWIPVQTPPLAKFYNLETETGWVGKNERADTTQRASGAGCVPPVPARQPLAILAMQRSAVGLT